MDTVIRGDKTAEECCRDPRNYYTTVCIDIYGRVYDLSKEHPSWEQYKKNKGKTKVYERCIVANAFTCTTEKCAQLKEKAKRKK